MKPKLSRFLFALTICLSPSNLPHIPPRLARALTPVDILDLVVMRARRVDNTLEVIEVRHELLVDRRHVGAALVAVVLHDVVRVLAVIVDVLDVAVRGVVDLQREQAVEILRESLLHLRLVLLGGRAGARWRAIVGCGIDVVGENVAGGSGRGRGRRCRLAVGAIDDAA